MQPNDFLFGSWDFGETEVGSDEQGFYAKAMGLEGRGPAQDIAVMDLNFKIQEAMETGHIRPEME